MCLCKWRTNKTKFQRHRCLNPPQMQMQSMPKTKLTLFEALNRSKSDNISNLLPLQHLYLLLGCISNLFETNACSLQLLHLPTARAPPSARQSFFVTGVAAKRDPTHKIVPPSPTTTTRTKQASKRSQHFRPATLQINTIKKPRR